MAIRYTSSFDETIAFSDTDAQFALAANIAQSWTVPGTSSQKFNLLFGMSSNANVFVGYNVTAAVPGAGTHTTTHGLEFMTPDSKRYAIGGDVISLISPDTVTYVGISVRSIPN